MLWYLYFKCLFELLFWMSAAQGINNMLLFYTYCVFETIIIVSIMAGSYYMKEYAKKIWIAAGVLLIGILIESFLNYEKGINAFTRFAEAVFLLLLCGFAITRLIKSPHRKQTRKLPEYWLARGIMLYFAIHIWVALTSNYTLQNFGYKATITLWIFNSSANILTNTIYLCWIIILQRKNT